MSFPGAEGRFMAVAVPNRDAVEGPSTIEEAEALTAAEAGQIVPYISDRMCRFQRLSVQLPLETETNINC